VSYRLRAPTQLKRRTVTRLGREIVPIEAGPADALRQITIYAPVDPVVYFAIGPQEPIEGDLEGVDNAGAEPEDIGLDRSFQWAPLGAAVPVPFLIRADQFISATAKTGVATMGVIIEYLET